MKNGFYESAHEAYEKVKEMPLKEGLEEALQWRSDDFGHSVSMLLEAESFAFSYFGEKFLEFLTNPTKPSETRTAEDVFKTQVDTSDTLDGSHPVNKRTLKSKGQPRNGG